MWRNYKIRSGRSIETFYAPDIQTAFALARAKWPGATAWECLGSTTA